MRALGIDYGDARVGLAITDPLGITAQGLETIHHDGNDKIVLKRLEEIVNTYEIDTFAIGMPYNMDGTKSERAEITEKFIHKLNCKFNKIRIEINKEVKQTKIKRDIGEKAMKILDYIYQDVDVNSCSDCVYYEDCKKMKRDKDIDICDVLYFLSKTI